MKKSTKAVLFSLLVFPGAGHFVLRRWLRGLLFCAPVIAASIFLVTYTVDKAFDAVDLILSGEVAMDTAAIEKVLDEPPPPKEALLLSSAKYLLLACWIAAAIDAGFLGAKVDRINDAAPLEDFPS